MALDGGRRPRDALARLTGLAHQPIKYLVYSHHHFDHIAGGKAFKDTGATVVALKRTQERLAQIKDPNTVMPDEVFDGHRTITLGDTSLELTFAGLNHSDNSIVMRLPKQKVLFSSGKSRSSP